MGLQRRTQPCQTKVGKICGGRGVAVRLRACAARRAYDGAPVSKRNGAAVAQRVQTLFIDDLDGSAAEGTVCFGLDGTEYEIDLNAEHAQQLRDALAAYLPGWAAGQRWLSPACSRWPPRIGEQSEHHRGPGVGQGAGHRGERPRASTR